MNGKTNIFFYSFLASGVLFAGVLTIRSDLYAGSKCRNFKSPGTCLPITNCTEAIEAVRDEGFHHLKRCGFDHFTEIVCCPNSGLRHVDPTPKTPVETKGDDKDDGDDQTPEVRARNVGKKSKKACEKYSENLPIDLTYHIVGGEDAEVGEFPHMAALGFYNKEDNDYRFNCGGTLISNYYVVTAAHCIITIQQTPLKIIRLGVIKVPEAVERPDPKIDYNVVNITVHPDYKWKEKFNDIALIKLEKKVTFTDSIRPACLYTKNDDPERLFVTGWGAISLGGEKSINLQKAVLTAVPLPTCNSTYLQRTNRNVVRSQICASDDNSDACQGDSGGPLQTPSNSSVLMNLVGVTSYGIGCGSKYPGIYTRISSYVDWIERVVWP